MARKAQITIYTALKDAGFKKAEKGLKNLRFQANGLNSSLAKLGLGVGVAQFARTSVRAAVEMEQANSRLAVSLNNIGKASMVGSASIRTSEKAMMSLGFEGTQTALALSTLVTATGSLEKSQGMLAASADLARFKNIDLASASKILAKASGGNAKAFKELGITMDKSVPPAEALEKAMGMLNAKIGGQAAAYATTYSGKLAILEAKFQDVQEQVGYKLLPVLVKLGDFLINTGIPRLEQFFTMIGNNKSTVVGFASSLTAVALAFKLIGTNATLAKVAALPLLAAMAPFIGAAAGLVGAIAATEAASKESKARTTAARGSGLSKFGVGARTYLGEPGVYGGFKGSPIPGMNKGKQTAGVDMQALQTAKDLAATQKQALALAKKEAALKAYEKRKVDAEKKLSAMFDLNQIALANALKSKLTEQERAAVLGLQALEDDGYKTEEQRMFAQEAALRKLISLKSDYASMAWDKTASLGGGEKQVSTGTVAGGITDLLKGSTDAMSTGQLAKQLQLEAFTPAPEKKYNGASAIAPSFSFNTDPSAQGTMTAQQSAFRDLIVNVQGTVMTESAVSDVVFNAMNKTLRNGASFYQNAASG